MPRELRVAVVVQEQVLQVGGRAREVEHVDPCGELDEAVGTAGEVTVEDRSPNRYVMHARQCSERLRVERRPELDRDLTHRSGVERRDLFDRDEEPFANDRDVITEVLDLVQHVRRQEHGAALGGDLTDELLELVLDERVEPRSRLVQDQELGLMHERLDERDLLSVPSRELADRTVDLHTEPCDEAVEHACVDATV